MEVKYLLIEADTNDGDYVHKITKLEGWSLEQLPTIRKVAQAISNHDDPYENNWQRHNYASNDCPPETMYSGILTEEEIRIFDKFRPNHEDGIHSINSVKIWAVIEEEDLV